MIAVVDTGGANLASVIDALERLDAKAELTKDPEKINASPRVILPGVGSAADAMQRLHAAGLIETLKGLTQPVLGICLGMQLLFASSQEGPTGCLGLLPGEVSRLGGPRPVPHMGWNSVSEEGVHPLLAGIAPNSYFYFVHSYRAPAGPWVKASAEYGEKIPAAVRKDNFLGVQFHPERSGAAGSKVLANFLAWKP
jgi:glutamine amidotransferase